MFFNRVVSDAMVLSFIFEFGYVAAVHVVLFSWVVVSLSGDEFRLPIAAKYSFT